MNEFMVCLFYFVLGGLIVYTRERSTRRYRGNHCFVTSRAGGMVSIEFGHDRRHIIDAESALTLGHGIVDAAKFALQRAGRARVQ